MELRAFRNIIKTTLLISMNSPSSKKHTQAFTLLEMLTVITVALILVALIIPGVFLVLDRIQTATCMSNMRSVGMACFNYRTDHNGWFPPGHPYRPGTVDRPNSLNFKSYLVPTYLPELLVCPAAKKNLTPYEVQAVKTAKRWFQNQGGSYAINTILTQWKLEAFPPPIGWWVTYQASNTPLLCEMYFGGSSTWAMVHQTSVLNGYDENFWGVPGRSHGRTKDALNFMFVDGHIELVSQNDPRNVPPNQKSWIYPTNPNGRFGAESRGARFVQTTQFAAGQFDGFYGAPTP